MLEDNERVRSLRLDGLDVQAAQAVLRTRGLGDSAGLATTVAECYSGNPLALKLVARTIHDLFGSDIAAFLSDKAPIFDDIRTVLDQQFERLSSLEREILVWLAIEHEGVSTQVLAQDLMRATPRRDLLEALRALQRRSLLEKTETGFALQSVVAEYVTDYIVGQASDEIESGSLDLLNRHALLKAQAREHVRQSQERVLLAPIATRLITKLGQAGLEARLRNLIDALRKEAPLTPGYAAGNVLNLLIHLGVDPSGLDLSRLSVWQASLRGKNVSSIDFSGSDLTGLTFSDTFGAVLAVAFSPDGEWLVAGTNHGEVRLWRAVDRQPARVIRGHDGPVHAIAFRAGGDVFASGSDDYTVCLWETRSCRLLRTLRGHSGWVRFIAFSPDGKTLASAGSDESIRLWDVASGEVRYVLHGHGGPVWRVAFHPDGRTLATGGLDRAVRIWECWQRRVPRRPVRSYRPGLVGRLQSRWTNTCHRRRRPYRSSLGRTYLDP